MMNWSYDGDDDDKIADMMANLMMADILMAMKRIMPNITTTTKTTTTTTVLYYSLLQT